MRNKVTAENCHSAANGGLAQDRQPAQSQRSQWRLGSGQTALLGILQRDRADQNHGHCKALLSLGLSGHE